MSVAKKFFLVLFSILSIGVFAAPKGGSKNGGGRPSSSKNRERRDSSRPSFSNASKSDSPSRKPSANPNEKKSPPAKNKNQPAPREKKPENFKSNSSSNFTQFSHDSSEIINYRGTRTLLTNGDFSLQSVKSEPVSDSKSNLEITFNQSVNPRTFTENSILIDGAAISPKKFTFNKKGDTIKIEVPSENKAFNLTIQNVESFDGTKIEPIQIEIKN